jgi:Tetratricopeptide repeat
MFRLFLCIFPFICLLAIPVVGFNYGTNYWLFSIPLSILASLLLSIIVDNITEVIGGAASKLFISGSANWTLHETLSGPLNQVRFLKNENRFLEAFVLLEKILTKTPNHTEALFLKAQLLWEGFKNISEAKVMLRQVIKITHKDDTYHRLAESFYRNLIEARHRKTVNETKTFPTVSDIW